MPNLLLDKDLNNFVEGNTMTKEQFLAAQAALDAKEKARGDADDAPAPPEANG